MPGRIGDADSFHDVSAATFGFPAFYGHNVNAWIDCLTNLDGPDAGGPPIRSNRANA
jgi:hypothetical protein